MIKKIIFFVSLFFLISSHVFADTVTSYYVQDTSSTKSTYWNIGDSWTYTDQYINYDSDTEKYVTLSTCLTGTLNFQITNNTAGSIRYLDYYYGERCTVQGYNGIMYYYVFYVDEFDYLPPSTYVNYFSLKVSNTESFKVVQDIFNVYTTSYNPIYNNDISSGLTDINDSINNTNNKLDDLNDSVNNTNDKLDNLNDSLNDSNTSDATDSANDFFSGFQTDTFGLTSIITAPLNLIGNITSSSCSSVGLPLPYVDKTLNLPCLSSIYQQYFGSFLTIYQTITFGIVAYWVCIRIFALVKDFKNPDHDEIEVLDL